MFLLLAPRIITINSLNSLEEALIGLNSNFQISSSQSRAFLGLTEERQEKTQHYVQLAVLSGQRHSVDSIQFKNSFSISQAEIPSGGLILILCHSNKIKIVMILIIININKIKNW